MSIFELTSKERSTLRSAAHALKPVVQIGDKGLTPSVIKEIDLNLNVHHLIKVKVASDDRELRTNILDQICEALACAKVAHLGKILILYRIDLSSQSHDDLAPIRQASERKPSEPHTPKKMAAAGKKVSSAKTSRPRKKGKTFNNELAPKSSINKPEGRPSTHNRSAVASTSGLRQAIRGIGRASHSIPARKGSSLSLRSGRRSAKK